MRPRSFNGLVDKVQAYTLRSEEPVQGCHWCTTVARARFDWVLKMVAIHVPEKFLCRRECGLPALLDGYCTGWPPARKAAYVAQQLSLQGSLDLTRCARDTAATSAKVESASQCVMFPVRGL